MKKSNLKLGMVVKTKDRKRYLVAEINGCRCLIGKEDTILLSAYTEEMKGMDPDNDIVAVYEQGIRPMEDILDMLGEPIWKSEVESVEITAAEAFRVLREYYGKEIRILEE